MIDVKELRVGNVLYVKYESKTHIVHSIHEYNTFNGGYAIRMENGFKCSLDYAEPVPLTEELLLKCGFNIECYEYCIKEQRLFAIEDFWILHNCHNDFYGVMCSNKVVRKIEHLHQLQNIYYALTGEELEVRL